MLNTFFQELQPGEISLRLFMAALGGSLIGIERLMRHKEAGLKTNTLVALGASVFGLIAANSAYLANWSASQFATGVVTGIGFLGSGVILQRGTQGSQDIAHLQGVNSAATIWSSAGLGLACGLGQYGLSLMALVAILIVQVLHRWIEERYGRGTIHKPPTNK